MIDADSFQLEANGRTHHCLVGKPDFTPPELHGQVLSKVTRTKIHDQFGLAVLIFQLLCMGRHPYHGRHKGPDLSPDQFIARNLFAYSLSRSTGVTPPPGATTLDIFPPEIRSAFERAFGTEPARRPSAAEWIGVLQGLEKSLSHCTTDASHYFPTAAKSCPWCKMEAASGAILFLPNFGTGAVRPIDLGNFDIDRVWAAIKAIVVPDAASLAPPMPALPNTPSEKAKNAKRAKIWPKLGGVVFAVLMILLWANVPGAALLCMLGLGAAFFVYNLKGPDRAGWQKKFADADQRLDDALYNWRTRLGHTQLVSLRNELERSVTELRELPDAKAQALSDLKAKRRDRQLHEHLDRFLIQRASISGIGPGKSATLRSFGIESAADVERYNIMNISGFGPATADKLLAWRRQLESRFVYNPAPTPADASAEAKVNADFATRYSALRTKLAGGQAELTQISTAMRQRMTVEDPRIVEFAKARAQLAVDLDHIGIPKPPPRATRPVAAPAPTRPATTPWTATPRPSVPNRNPMAISCPRCGSQMVRRTARRGRNAGNIFWGCSRYPHCSGTRP